MDYKIGSIIKYKVGSEIRTVEVTDKLSDVKNGQPGFDAKVVGSERTVWGYEHQIIAVEKSHSENN